MSSDRETLKQIQDALVEAFYDYDDPKPLDYKKVDWVGMVKDARTTLDYYKGASARVRAGAFVGTKG